MFNLLLGFNYLVTFFVYEEVFVIFVVLVVFSGQLLLLCFSVLFFCFPPPKNPGGCTNDGCCDEYGGKKYLVVFLSVPLLRDIGDKLGLLNFDLVLPFWFFRGFLCDFIRNDISCKLILPSGDVFCR